MSTTEVRRLYDKVKASKARVILSVFLALLIAIVISVSVGYGSPGFIEATQVILSRIFPFLEINPGSKAIRIIFYIRLLE
jgi:hypothetical protein